MVDSLEARVVGHGVQIEECGSRVEVLESRPSQLLQGGGSDGGAVGDGRTTEGDVLGAVQALQVEVEALGQAYVTLEHDISALAEVVASHPHESLQPELETCQQRQGPALAVLESDRLAVLELGLAEEHAARHDLEKVLEELQDGMELSLSLIKEQKEDQAEAMGGKEARLARLEAGFLQSAQLQSLLVPVEPPPGAEGTVSPPPPHDLLVPQASAAPPRRPAASLQSPLFDSRGPQGPHGADPSQASPQAALSANRLHELRRVAHQNNAAGGAARTPDWAEEEGEEDGTPRWQTVSFSPDASDSEYSIQYSPSKTPAAAGRERGWSVLDDGQQQQQQQQQSIGSAYSPVAEELSPAGKVYFE